jgi:predicted NodU family carbamoyl transferase
MPVMLQVATKIHTTVRVPGHELRHRFKASPISETSCLTIDTIGNDTVKNEQLQKTVRQAIIFAPYLSIPSLQARSK